MSVKYLIKRSNVPGKKPNLEDIEIGELAVNVYDRLLYTKGIDPETGDEIIINVGRIDWGSYSGNAGKMLVVNDEENGIKFEEIIHGGTY